MIVRDSPTHKSALEMPNQIKKQKHLGRLRQEAAAEERGAYEVDGGPDVLGDGRGALVVARLVPVEPPDVLRLHGPQVAPLVRQPPPPRRLRSSSADSHPHGSVHLHHRHRSDRSENPAPDPAHARPEDRERERVT